MCLDTVGDGVEADVSATGARTRRDRHRRDRGGGDERAGEPGLGEAGWQEERPNPRAEGDAGDHLPERARDRRPLGHSVGVEPGDDGNEHGCTEQIDREEQFDLAELERADRVRGDRDDRGHRSLLCQLGVGVDTGQVDPEQGHQPDEQRVGGATHQQHRERDDREQQQAIGRP